MKEVHEMSIIELAELFSELKQTEQVKKYLQIIDRCSQIQSKLIHKDEEK